MAQQTAVDYLIKQISEILGPLKTEGMTDLLLVDAIQKAKQMEKEQIQEAWNDGNFLGRNGNILADYSDGNRYYKKEFENK